MGMTFTGTPVLFGPFHLGALFLIVVFNIFFGRYIAHKDEPFLLRLLHHSGIVMLIGEIGKQLFCYHYVFDHRLNLWFFPWQLCSMAMYLSFAVIYLDESKRQTALTFLGTYSLLAAVIALAIPEDMLRKQVLLTLHGFLYHGIMISQALIAIVLLKKRPQRRFRSSFLLFLGMAAIAELINVLSHLWLNNIHLEPNMFYITPYYPTTQPFFHELALDYGQFAEVIVYLGSISLGSYLIYRFLINR